MSNPFNFHRISKNETPTGGWKLGHIYFIHDSSAQVGEIKVCTNITGPILEAYLHPTTTILDTSTTDNDIVSGKTIYDSFGNKIINQTESTVEIAPNVMNLWGEIASLTITLATASDANRTNEYMLQFTSPSSAATTFSYPSTITWAESNATTISSSVVVPNIEAGKTYQISIVNNKGIIGGF